MMHHLGPCLALPMRQSCRLAPASSVRTSSLLCMTRLFASPARGRVDYLQSQHGTRGRKNVRGSIGAFRNVVCE